MNLILYETRTDPFTTYAVARAAGFSDSDAFQYAYWSQYPDQNPAFDASKNFLNESVGKYLHSLTGGDPVKLRKYLECLLKSSKFSLAESGMLIHALGDAYAHTYTDNNKFLGSPRNQRLNPNYGKDVLFPPRIGHFFSGHAPDFIGNNPKKYGEYVDQLYETMQSLNPGGNYDPSTINNLKLQAYLMPPSSLMSDVFTSDAQNENSNEAFRLGILSGGYYGSSNLFNPDGSVKTLRDTFTEQWNMPVDSIFGDSRNSLIQKIKNGVSGCCPGVSGCCPNN